MLPACLYITVKKGVQLTAIQILCRQLIEHSRYAPTRIMLQFRPKTGKFSYNTWISSTKMSQHDETSLYHRFLNITKEGKRTQTFLVRQNIRKGHIHEIWHLNHSLL